MVLLIVEQAWHHAYLYGQVERDQSSGLTQYPLTYLWWQVIPAVLRPENTSRSMIAEFDETVSRGFTLLQPASRLLVVSMAALALATYCHPDAATSGQWTYHLAAGLIIAQTAWFEIVFIFPVNDRISALKRHFVSKEDYHLPAKQQRELRELLEEWQRWQWGRVVLPLVAGVVALAVVL
jgi:hypothetical protein